MLRLLGIFFINPVSSNQEVWWEVTFTTWSAGRYTFIIIGKAQNETTLIEIYLFWVIGETNEIISRYAYSEFFSLLRRRV